MGIKFECEHCGRTLNVKDFLAGKRGICPKCGGRIEIPGPGGNGSPAAPGADQSRAAASANGGADPIAESPQSKWFVLPAGSTKNYGPALGEVMRQWLREGRISADALVWREGWSEWRKAAVAFPQLAATGPVAATATPAVSPVGLQAAFAPTTPSVVDVPEIVIGPSVASPFPKFAAPRAEPIVGPTFEVPAAQLATPQSAATFAPVAAPLIVPAAAPGAPARAVVARRRSNTVRNLALAVLVLAVIALAIPLVWVLTKQ